MTQELIITADDLGYSVTTNSGILECFQSGAVTQTSLLVGAVAAEDGVQQLDRWRDRIGLHLNLSEGIPLSPPHLIPSLINKDGKFLGKLGIKEKAIQGQITSHEVRREVEAQMMKFKALVGCAPAHIDGHQHVHVYPVIRDVLSDYLDLTRIPVEEGLASCEYLEPERMDFYQVVEREANIAKSMWAERGVRFPDNFIGLSTMGNDMNIKRLQERILSHVQDTQQRVVELMVHPAHSVAHILSAGCEGPEGGGDTFNTSPSRKWEMDCLMSVEMSDFYSRNQIQLIPGSALCNR